MADKQVSWLTSSTPTIDDLTISYDNADTSELKKTTWQLVRDLFKTYFDTVYQAVLVSWTNIKTVNGNSLLGSGDIAISGGGDMLTSTYDPTNVSWDAFDMENMVEGATNKILTTAERTKLTNTSGTNSGDQTSIVGITGTKAQFDTACTDGNFLYSGDIISASTTVQGIVELATTAEINTGTDSTRAMPIDQFVDSNRNVRYFDIYAIEKATDNAVGTNIIGAIECPFTWTITEIGAYVETAWVTGASVWDVNKNGTTIMTTNKLSIDSAEVSTRTAATAPTLTTTAITAGDLITIDTDSLSTTKPKWLHIRIWIRQS